MPGEEETSAAPGAPSTQPETTGEQTAQLHQDTKDVKAATEKKVQKAEGGKGKVDDESEKEKADGGQAKEEEKTEEGKKAEEGREEDEVEEVKTMKSVVLTGFGGLRNLKEQAKPQPSPAEGQVLIRVQACGMGFQDLMLRQGNVEHPPRTPFIMGCECAGLVEAVGGTQPSPFAVGDRVMALTESGAWAEVVVAPVTQVYKLPEGVTFEDGVCLLTHYVTAYALLFDLAHLRRGHSVLLHSAAGGVGQAVIQLCHTVGEVTVFGTASAHKHQSIRDRVAHLFPHSADYVQEIRKVSPEGVDIVLDCLCGEDTNRGISLLKPLGTYILYGTSNIVSGETKSFLSSAKSWLQLNRVSPNRLHEESHMIGGFNLRRLLFRQGRHVYVRSIVERLLDMCVQGKVTPVIDSVWAFGDVGEGMQRLQDRKNIGKVLLDPSKEATTKRADSKAGSVVEAAEVAGKSEEVKDDQKAETEETPAAKDDQKPETKETPAATQQ